VPPPRRYLLKFVKSILKNVAYFSLSSYLYYVFLKISPDWFVRHTLKSRPVLLVSPVRLVCGTTEVFVTIQHTREHKTEKYTTLFQAIRDTGKEILNTNE
jgi:hypothetical protein